MSESTSPLYRSHPRIYGENRFVYPVLSRRAKGLSIGVNLNPDKICNFHCLYCQVDRTAEPLDRFVDAQRLENELDGMLEYAASGAIYADPAFQSIPADLRRLNDIAFSGDGEPTTFRNFDDIVNQAATLKAKHRLNATKLVLITNASMLHRPHVQRALETFDGNNGEVWAKLDAGTDKLYQKIARSSVPFRRILDNITDAACRRPLVIQTLLMAIDGKPFSEVELAAYCTRLTDITANGGQIKLVQFYTIARKPEDASVTPLRKAMLDCFARTVSDQTGLPVEVF